MTPSVACVEVLFPMTAPVCCVTVSYRVVVCCVFDLFGLYEPYAATPGSRPMTPWLVRDG